MGLTKSLLWFIFSLLGLAGFGVIVVEILKKWNLISRSLSPIWVTAPILVLFIAKLAAHSPYLRTRLNLSPNYVNRSQTVINIILVILGILALISLPFLWYGVIEELAAQNR
jgi:hypothetical protein